MSTVPTPLIADHEFSPDSTLTAQQHRIVTALAAGHSITEAAASEDIHRNTVGYWRRTQPTSRANSNSPSASSASTGTSKPRDSLPKPSPPSKKSSPIPGHPHPYASAPPPSSSKWPSIPKPNPFTPAPPASPNWKPSPVRCTPSVRTSSSATNPFLCNLPKSAKLHKHAQRPPRSPSGYPHNPAAIPPALAAPA